MLALAWLVVGYYVGRIVALYQHLPPREAWQKIRADWKAGG